MTAKMTEKKKLMEVLEVLYTNMRWSIEGQEEQAKKWDTMTEEEKEQESYQEEWSENAKDWLKAWNTIEQALDKLI